MVKYLIIGLSVLLVAVFVIVEATREKIDPADAPLMSAVQRLNTGSPDDRREAALRLAELATAKPQLAAPALIDALRDSESKVRLAAIETIGALRIPEAVDGLVQVFANTGPDWSLERKYACDALGALKDPKAIPTLVKALEDEEPTVRNAAAFALGGIGSDAVPALRQAFGGGSPASRAAAAYGLGRAKDAQSFDALVAAVADAHIPLRRGAIGALGQLADTRAVPVLAGVLQSPLTKVQTDALAKRRAAGPDEDSLPEIRNRVMLRLGADAWEALDEKARQARIREEWNRQIDDEQRTGEHEIRSAVVEAMVAIDSPAADKELLTALGAKDQRIADTAQAALADQGERARRVVLAGVADRAAPPDLRLRAVEIARRLSLQSQVAETMLVEVADPKSPIRAQAIRILGELKEPRAVDPLLAILATKDASTGKDATARDLAAGALAAIGDRRAVPALIAAIEGPESRGNGAVAGALAAFQAQEAVAPLLDLLAKMSFEKGKASPAAGPVIVALGKLGDRRATAPLVQLLQAGVADWGVTMSLREALRLLRDPAALDPLLALVAAGVKDQSKRMYPREFATVLGAIGDPRAVPVLAEGMRTGDTLFFTFCGEALGMIRHASAAEAALAALREMKGKEDIQKAAAEALAAQGEVAVPVLLANIDDADPDFGGAMAQILVRSAKVPAVQRSMLDTLATGSERAIPRALHVLGTVRDPALVERTIPLLRHASADVRVAACWALSQAPDARAIDPLMQALAFKDDKDRTSKAAEFALNTVKSELENEQRAAKSAANASATAK